MREVPAAGAPRHHRRVDAARLRRRQEQGPGQHRQEPGGGPQPARLVRREAEGDQAAGGELCPGLESGVLLYTIQCIVAAASAWVRFSQRETNCVNVCTDYRMY